MSDNKDNKKKGFFARLFGGSNTSKESNNAKPTPIEKDEIPTLSSVKKMKKATLLACQYFYTRANKKYKIGFEVMLFLTCQIS